MNGKRFAFSHAQEFKHTPFQLSADFYKETIT